MPEPISINDMISNFQDNILPAIAPMMGGISEQVNIPVPEVNINNDAVAIVNNGQGYVDTGTNTNQQPQPDPQPQQPQQPLLDLSFTPSSTPGYFLPSTSNYGAIPIAGTVLDQYGTTGYTLDQIKGLEGAAGLGTVTFDMLNGTGMQTVQQAAQAIAAPPVYTQVVPGSNYYSPPQTKSTGLTSSPEYSSDVYGQILGSGQPSNAQAVADLWMATGNNIYGITNYDDPAQRLLTTSFQGTPWYQATGYTPQYSADVQAVIDKVNRWNALTPEEQLYRSGNPDWYPTTEEKVRAAASVSALTYDEEQAYKRYLLQQNLARGEELMRTASSVWDNNYQVGLALTTNNHITPISLQNPNSRIALPEGNQMARSLLNTAYTGLLPPEWLLNYANNYDAFADWSNPSGVWNAWVPSGSKEGMGGYGTGSYFTGIPDVVFPDGDRAYTNGSNYAGSGNYQDGRSIIGPVLPPGYSPPSASPTTSGGSRIVTGEILGRNKGVQDYGPGTGQPIADLSNPGNWGYPNDPTIFAPQPFDYIGPDSSSGQVPAFPDNSNPLTTRQYLTDPQTGQVVLNPDGSPQYLDRTYNPVPTSRYLNGGNNSAYIPYDGNSSMADIIPPFQSSMGEIVRNNTPFADGSDYIQNLMGGYAPGTALDNLAPNSPALNSHAGSMGGGVQNFGTGFAQGMFDAYYGYNGQGAGIYPASDVFGTTGYGPATNYVHYKR